MEALVTKKRTPLVSIPLGFIAAIAIYSMFIPLFVVDVWVSIYQAVYFRIMDIPRMKRSDYVVMDRWDLSRLSLLQKLNCVYCEYVNGITAYAKAIAGQTEIHSCAIKHRHLVRGQQEGDQYYKYSDFK